MILQMIKKQALHFFRNPVEILLLIGLPVILITILGNALGNLMEGGEVDISFTLGVVEHEEEAAQVERFMTELEESNLPVDAVESLKSAAVETAPVDMFLSIFQSGKLQDMITVNHIAAGELEAVKENDTHAAIIEFPREFTYQLLENMLVDELNPPEVKIHYNEGAEIAGNIVEQILTTYQEEYTLATFLGKHGINPEEMTSLSSNIEREISSIGQLEPVGSKAYYTIGMVVMNILFMATTIASYAFQEKQNLIFDRMILADLSRWTYFLSVLVMGVIFSFIQSLIVFMFAYFIFDVTWPDMGAFLIITLFFAIAVGGLAVLLTAISFSFDSERIINFFSGVIVTIFAFVGGSFFPIGHGTWLERLGDFTPNGAAMSAYLSIMRGETVVDNLDHLLFIICFALAAIIIGVLSFPKRGAAS